MNHPTGQREPITHTTMDKIKEALERLVALKQHKDIHGKDYFYEKEQPLAWANAADALLQSQQEPVAWEDHHAMGRVPKSTVAWYDTAAQYARDMEFYRGLVYEIGELFGDEAKTSDDGSLQDSVLALKVPELVRSRLAAPQPTPEVARLLVAGDAMDKFIDATVFATPYDGPLPIQLSREWRVAKLSSAPPVGAEGEPNQKPQAWWGNDCGWMINDQRGFPRRATEQEILAAEASRVEVPEPRTYTKQEVEAIEKDRDNLRRFIENIIKNECWNRVEYLDGGDVQDEAERMGVLVQVPHPLPCTVENCGCEGENVDFLFHFAWHGLNTDNHG